jgi:hypothetical protein
MTFHQFEKLASGNKYKYLLQKGTFLVKRKSIKYDFLLYELNGFYVEVMYDANQKTVLLLEPFTDTNLLAPYLYKVDITELMNL